jgi:UDP-4-amino-4-deoxy-L-arabinose formyltransferase/UDP-glucuronic acid dehydrogenase (UDP-4-keto-hexauronic acid decarboxylating)
MVSEQVLAIPKHGSFNLHGSLLPAYRGRAPANWAILKGETRNRRHAAPYDQPPRRGRHRRTTPRADHAGRRRAHTLILEAGRCGAGAARQTLPLIRAGTAPRIPQDESAASYYGRRTPADGVIDWRKPAADIVNLVRAVTRPYPGAFTYTRAAKILVWQAEALKNAPRGGAPGQVLNVDPFEVACGDGAVRILFGQQQGGVYCGGAQLAKDLNIVEARSSKPRLRGAAAIRARRAC